MSRVYGIRGLRWSNVFWVAFFLSLIPMIATADGYLKLNYKLITDAWKTLSTGGKNLWISQGRFARTLDQATAKKYGYDPIEKRSQVCMDRPNPAPPLTPAMLGAVTNATSRSAVYSAIGGSYCKLTSGAEIWLVGSEQVFRVDFQTGSKQLMTTEALLKADLKPVPIPKNRQGRDN